MCVCVMCHNYNYIADNYIAERQVREAIQIANTPPNQVMNTRAEYLRPVIQRLTHTDLIPDVDRNRGHGT